jgi:hypothetical protein
MRTSARALEDLRCPGERLKEGADGFESPSEDLEIASPGCSRTASRSQRRSDGR